MSDFTGLSIAGRIATPSDPDWDEARLAWNLIADQRPEAVAFAESGEDIAAVVRFAAENGLRVAGQGTGHGATALGAPGALEQAMRPWAAEGSYFNFTESPCDVDAILPSAVCARLVEVKRQYDPDDMIVANHTVSLAPS